MEVPIRFSRSFGEDKQVEPQKKEPWIKDLSLWVRNRALCKNYRPDRFTMLTKSAGFSGKIRQTAREWFILTYKILDPVSKYDCKL